MYVTNNTIFYDTTQYWEFDIIKCQWIIGENH